MYVHIYANVDTHMSGLFSLVLFDFVIMYLSLPYVYIWMDRGYTKRESTSNHAPECLQQVMRGEKVSLRPRQLVPLLRNQGGFSKLKPAELRHQLEKCGVSLTVSG